jgi:lipid II:glycine glycyltransferase (peptidoglycan interpeptide bridge formation enzyme)
MPYLSLNTPDPQTWNTFVQQHPQGSILQTTTWGHLKADFGWDWDVVALGQKQAPNAGALILYRKLPFNVGTIAYVPRGPLVDWSNGQATTDLLQAIEQSARRHRAWALWLEPNVLDGAEIRQRLKALGMTTGKRTVQPPRTILVDLTADEDEILMRMKSKTRYNIRYAKRKGVIVRQGTVDDAEVYYNLMETTAERNEFGIHTQRYYREVLERFLPQDQAALFIAEVDNDPVAAIIVFALGETAWYFYGASSNRHRKKMPTYALQWAAMRWAKTRGCTTYDLWGIPDFDEETLEDEFIERSDGLWGVYRFKRGFGGEVVRYAGLWEKVLNPLYPVARKVRTWFDNVR